MTAGARPSSYEAYEREAARRIPEPDTLDEPGERLGNSREAARKRQAGAFDRLRTDARREESS